MTMFNTSQPANKTEADVAKEVKAILTLAGASADQMYVTVKAMHKSTSKYSFRTGSPTGAFTIELWGLRTEFSKHTRGEAAGRFRTKNDGTIPSIKIREYADQQIGRIALRNAAETAKETATKATADTHSAVLAYAKAVLPNKYWSDYRSSYGNYITNDTAVAGKVAIDVGTLVVNEDQAKALLDLIASFK